MSLRTFKFVFHAEIGKLVLNTSVKCEMSASWKRSNQSDKGQSILFQSGVANFNQILTIPVNMYFDPQANIFQQKKSQFSFTLHTIKGDKSAGIVIVDLAPILNNKTESIQDYFKLDKCPDKQAKVYIKITYESLGQVANSIDQRSSLNQNIQTNLSMISLQKLSQSAIGNKLLDPQLLKSEFKKPEMKPAIASDDSKKQLQKLNNQVSSLKAEMLRSKSIQQKLQKQIIQLRRQKQNQDVELQLTKKKLIEAYQELQQAVVKYI